MNWGTAHEKDAVLCAFVQACRVLCLALCRGGVRGTESEFVCVGGGSLPLSGYFGKWACPLAFNTPLPPLLKTRWLVLRTRASVGICRGDDETGISG